MKNICEKFAGGPDQCGETLKRQPLTIIGGLALTFVIIHTIIAVCKTVWRFRWVTGVACALLGAGYALNTRRDAADEVGVDEIDHCADENLNEEKKPSETVEPIE